MECKEAEHSIAAFLEDILVDKQLQRFVLHIEECPSCKEELAIQYLIRNGMLKLEEGNNFDLNLELNNKMEIAKKKISFRQIAHCGLKVIEIAGVIAILIFFLMVVV